MTKQEHLEDVLFRISKTSNRLSTYLNEAPAIMQNLKKIGDLEKKSNPEKNSDPEKKFDPVQQIRAEWIDEVTPLMLDEDEFNLTNMLTAISASIEAMNQLLDITKEKIGIIECTRLEKLRKEHPELSHETDEDIVMFHCPCDFDYDTRAPIKCQISCEKCWNKRYNPLDLLDK